MDEAKLSYITAVFPEAMKPYVSNDWEVIITAVYRANGINCDVYSLWQVGKGNTGSLPNRESKVAKGENQLATIANYKNKFHNDDQLIIVELFLNYQPLLDNAITRSIGLGRNEIYTSFVSRPRYGAFMKNPITGNDIPTKCKLSTAS